MSNANSADKVEHSPSEASLLARFGAELAVDLDHLVLLHDCELTTGHLQQLSEFRFSENLALLLDDQDSTEVCRRLDALVSQLSKSASQSTLDLLAADYASIYLNYTYRASPLESVWMDDENLTYQGSMFDLRKIYEKHGLFVQNWRTRSEDHLVCQLEFMATILRSGDLSEERLHELATFYDEHMFRWFNQFRETVCTRCDSEFYGLAARLTDNYLEKLRDCISQIIEDERPTREAIEAKLARGGLNSNTYELKFVPGHAPSW